MVTTDKDALAVLARADAAMVEVLGALKTLDQSSAVFRTLKVGIAANVTVDLLANYLRRHAYLAGVRLEVAKGNYDDLVGDVQAHAQAGVDLLLILPFFDNLQPAWETQLETLDAATRQAAQADYLSRLRLALQSAQGVGQVLLLGAHLWNPQVADSSPQQQALDAFNAGLAEAAAAHANTRLLETAGLLARVGTRQAFDARFYLRAKAPYTAPFIDHLAREVALATRQFGSVFHKVLVLDGDNTLWGGIVGEDGVDGVKLDPYSFPGNVFWTVQQQLKALEAQGVLLCLNSKNNAADVEELMREHPAMVLKDGHIVARRVNWDDKPSNLRALAAELNLGLDSFVFIDDSAFEIEAVREQLPQVTVFQVPKVLHDYPALVREQVMPLFLAGGVSAESRSKTQQYKSLAEAAQLQASFGSQEEYLRSLALSISLQRDASSQVARITELIGKSNQFNLTTTRLQAGDVAALMERADATVYSFSVSDRLAEHGLTGVLITVDEGSDTVVHSFLMSCRVIGRGVEFAIWRAVVADALARGKQRLRASYRKTAKNALVADFYDRLGLTRTNEADDGSRSYEAPLANLQLAESAWVELRNA
ncbi:HAD-IIIC family phosphatase [Roseateles toxinivorans]|uniref:HAD superfamily phosphatase (TIGR01681 family)/FkbH-like protein n=1 Tax=Roseateles toxinivorans TaxID=270368 RepID=A0A4R6QL76_9BURK|nr:HAD-IIIC family phosphatase [Roseateles toxinivorans]TDP64330.1 HAD superfamily phosphatase (TIGR01681 family)/FkbH-like protein [Roseateles toxinivorans]